MSDLSGRQECVDVHDKEPEHDWEEDLNPAQIRLSQCLDARMVKLLLS